MKKISTLVLLIVVFLIAASCSAAPDTPYEYNYDDGRERTVFNHGEGNILFGSDYPSYEDVEDLYRVSTHVLLGKFIKGDIEYWNLSRDPNNPEEESKVLYLEAIIYPFEIERSLKGDVKSNDARLSIQHGAGSASDEKVTIYRDYTFYEPAVDEYCIMFLNYDKELDLYYLPAWPYEYRLSNGDILDAESAEFTLVMPWAEMFEESGGSSYEKTVSVAEIEKLAK